MKNFGKISKVNHLPKEKVISSHIKKTASGIKMVKAYVRSN